MLTRLIVFFFAFIIQSVAYGQKFTKISSGDFVSDGGESFGAAWGDLNKDSYPDLFVSNGGAANSDANNFLYINNGDGTFTKVNDGIIVSDSQKSNGASIGDFNNDGLPDIAVANRNGQKNELYLNTGDLVFSKIDQGFIASDGGNSNAISWVDYNGDGWLDLFITNFFELSFLYTNSESNIFGKITGVNPVAESNTSISSAWADFDNDGDQDVYVANAAASGKENLFYINNGLGSFDKVILGDLVKDKRASMGATWADYDNDGDLDLFVANQNNHSNDLYRNNGKGSFTAIRDGIVVTEKNYSVSGSFADIDNDGDLDLFVNNWQYNRNFLYLNSGYPDYTFSKIDSGAIATDQENSMAAGWADYDNDGDLDLFVANRDNTNNSFYRNDTKGHNWVQVSLSGKESNQTAVGSKLRIKTQLPGVPVWQMREINAQHGYNSQNDLRVHFGVGNSVYIDSLTVEWPSGLSQHFENLTVNTFYSLTEGENIEPYTTALESSNTEQPRSFIIMQNYPNPFNPSTTIEINIPYRSHIRLEVFDLSGKRIAVLFNGFKDSGRSLYTFSGNSLNSGIYFYRLSAGNQVHTRKMFLIR